MRRVKSMVRLDTLEQKKQLIPPRPKYPPPVSCRPHQLHCDSSFRRFSCRHICSPQVCSSPVEGYRSCENGIRSSAVQPSESMFVCTSHTGSHDGSPPPPRPFASCLTPDGFTVEKSRPM